MLFILFNCFARTKHSGRGLKLRCVKEKHSVCDYSPVTTTDIKADTDQERYGPMFITQINNVDVHVQCQSDK